MARSIINRRWAQTAALATAAALSAGAIAYAAIPGTDGIYSACYDATHVALIDAATTSSCAAGQTPLKWNIRGRIGPTGDVGRKGETGDRGPTGPAGNPGSYEQHWVLTKGDTSNSYQAASDPGAQIYYYYTGERFVWLGRDVTNCAVTAVPEDPNSNGYGPPATTVILKYYGYVLTETYRMDSTGKMVPSDVPVNVTAYC